MGKLILKDFSHVSYDKERDIERYYINDDYSVKLYIDGEIIEWDSFGYNTGRSEISYAEIGCRKERFKKIDGHWEWRIIEKFKGFQHITLGLDLSRQEIFYELNNAFRYRSENKPNEHSRYDFHTSEAYERYIEKYQNFLNEYLTVFSYPCTISFYKDYEKAFSPVNSKGYHTGRLKKRQAEMWKYDRWQVCDLEIKYKEEDPIYISVTRDRIYDHLVELFTNNAVLFPRSYEETGIYKKAEERYYSDMDRWNEDYIREANEDFAREMNEHDAWGNID